MLILNELVPVVTVLGSVATNSAPIFFWACAKLAILMVYVASVAPVVGDSPLYAEAVRTFMSDEMAVLSLKIEEEPFSVSFAALLAKSDELLYSCNSAAAEFFENS